MQKKYNYISKRHYDHDKKTLKIIHSFKILKTSKLYNYSEQT